ncbi:phage tail protein [Nostoc sp. UHCC 0302]|uniref:phage tail protein n=1 Tax=Nostoc sp. UHCC 0302 TaxID=3134896 RepID=UPI00311C8DB9
MFQVPFASKLGDKEFLTQYRFFVGLNLGWNDSDSYFLECQGITRTQEVIEICEVTSQKWAEASKGRPVITKLPGNTKSGNIILRKGLTRVKTWWDWFEKIETGKWSKERKNIYLSIYNQEGKERARFELNGGWPTSYKISDFNANSHEIEIEEMELAFEEFQRVEPTVTGYF